MIFGFKIDKDIEKVNSLITEWNEIFSEPTRRIISDTRYYMKNDNVSLKDGTYVMSIKPMFPIGIWGFVFGLAIISSIFFGLFKTTIILSTIFTVLLLFFIPYLYFLGTKNRLKRAKYAGKVIYISKNKLLDSMFSEV